jgi:uncharacterized sulfatase
MNRRQFLGALGAGAAALLPKGMAFQARAAGESNAARKPNFVLLVADDLTWHDIGCYGGRNVKTPNIDSLARDGMKFNLAFTAASMCTPCRTMLYTGLFPVKNGAQVHPDGAVLPAARAARLRMTAGRTSPRRQPARLACSGLRCIRRRSTRDVCQ